MSNVEPHPSLSSTTFGKYQPFATLGRGGMADVFLAVSRGAMGFNRLAVVKRLRPNLAAESDFVTMFLDEARLAARLNHPNLVHTYEVGEHDGAYLIAMEYLEGQALSTVMRTAITKERPLPTQYCVRIAADALLGLHHAHELRDFDGTHLQIVHRDISPHNVFVTYDGNVKLMDFGIAKARSSSTQTEVGVLKGKVAYMAPEQAAGEPVDRRADVFAMGIVMWEMATRQRLLHADNAAVSIHRLCNTTMPRASTVAPEIDPYLDDVIAKALARSPNDRFQTALEMRDALEEFLARSTGFVRSEQLGSFVTGLFEAARHELKQQIQQHMPKAASVFTTQDLEPLKLDVLRKLQDSSGSRALHTTDSGLVSSAEIPVGLGAVVGTDPALQPKKGRGRLIGAAIGAVALASVAVIFVVRRGPEPATAAAAVPSAAASVTSAPAVSVAAIPATPSEPIASAVAEAPASKPSPHGAARGVSGRNVATSFGRSSAPPAAAPEPRRPSAAPAATEPVPQEANGFLTFDTYPWTRVTEGGRVLGTTPIVRVPLSAGPHTLTLENGEEGIRQTTTVVIKPNETMSKRMAFK